MNEQTKLIKLLATIPVKPVLPVELQHGPALWLDFSDSIWADAAQCSVDELIQRTQQLLKEKNAVLAVGRYAEDRAMLYSRSPLFGESEALRSIHLGIDLTVPASTPVATPLAATVHSFADNASFGDYGPTVILRHEIAGFSFYTLYGHLNRACLTELTVGQALKAGEVFAKVGSEQENGCWPPHLHFQLIKNLQDYRGGYPGVTSLGQAHADLENCPDPNCLLRLAMPLV